MVLALIEHLLESGHKVSASEDLSMDPTRNLKRLRRLSDLELTTHGTLFQNSDLPNFNQIYHLACPGRQQYEDDPVQALELSFMGTKNLLDIALRSNARVVFASAPAPTGPIIRERHPSPVWENRLRKRKRPCNYDELSGATKRRRLGTSTIDANSMSYYDQGNRIAEMLCFAYKSHFGLDVRVARVSAKEGLDGSSFRMSIPTESEVWLQAEAASSESQVESWLSGLTSLMDDPASNGSFEAS